MKEMSNKVKKELFELTELASPTFAKKLGVSYETGFYILSILEHLPEMEEERKRRLNKFRKDRVK